jgi:2-(1,2-epoxy-1,2-dihydrophenyl)acetyl-CoA isomerase
LAEGPTLAFGRVKDLVLHSDDSLESQMEKETRLIADSARTSDAQEGIHAFLEKRKASFSGR